MDPPRSEAQISATVAAGTTDEVARLARVGIATVFRHFPTKNALVEAALLDHFARLTAQACVLAEHPDPAEALCTLFRIMIDTGATKITLASLGGERGELPGRVRSASDGLRAGVELVLHRAQDCGLAHREVTVDELYLLIRGISQASATLLPPPAH